ncbi:WAT1-related protein [Platanthera guangdongensis]|uniref:WAT1-related protein n=1 Tax=Platanthera guangdongensis TaxID=2320717 RepID=A0ABR2LHE1_9ASPA
MGRDSHISAKLKLISAVLLLHLCYASSHIVSRAALNLGVSKMVLLVYRNIIATVLVAPFAYFLEKNERSKLTFSILVQLFLLALFGITLNQACYLLGMYYLSPTYVSAIQNSMPGITFAMAAVLRLEQVKINKKYGIAKIIGTFICIGGATIITLYKGPPLFQAQPYHNTLGGFLSSGHILNWTLGCVYILGNCIAWAGWLVFQVPMLEQYPARLSLTSFSCFFGMIQLLCIAAFVETDIERWKIHSEGELFTIVYIGLVATGIAFCLQTWCIDRAGPLFVAVFQPLQTVLVAVMAFVVFGDLLYSGGLIGFIVIIVGLYTVLWGMGGEKKTASVERGDLTNNLLEHEVIEKDMII